MFGINNCVLLNKNIFPGLAAYCYHHSQSQQPAIRTTKHLVIAQNGADAKNTKKFYVGIPLDGSYGIDM